MEKVSINNEDYRFTKNIREDYRFRKQFNKLADNTFNIDFKDWYENAYWTDRYIPYVLIYKDEIVSNVSVNKIYFKYNNKEYFFIQIGTVMTDERFRNKGLADYLMKRVLKDWEDKVDNIYLYANDSVLDFYPRYGFKKSYEYVTSLTVDKKYSKLIKLNLDKKEDIENLHRLYTGGNPYSNLNMIDNFELMMFHCNLFLRDNIYYIEEYDAIGIVEYMDRTMICYDLFASKKENIEEVLGVLAAVDTNKIELGFNLADINSYGREKLIEDDTSLFILNNSLFEDKITLPFLSRA